MLCNIYTPFFFFSFVIVTLYFSLFVSGEFARHVHCFFFFCRVTQPSVGESNNKSLQTFARSKKKKKKQMCPIAASKQRIFAMRISLSLYSMCLVNCSRTVSNDCADLVTATNKINNKSYRCCCCCCVSVPSSVTIFQSDETGSTEKLRIYTKHTMSIRLNVVLSKSFIHLFIFLFLYIA